MFAAIESRTNPTKTGKREGNGTAVIDRTPTHTLPPHQLRLRVRNETTLIYEIAESSTENDASKTVPNSPDLIVERNCSPQDENK